MSLYVFGLNYHSASLAIREKFAFNVEIIPQVLQRLQISGVVTEALILSTCNRSEIYCTTNDIDFVINAICEIKKVCPRDLGEHSYYYQELNCVEHLFQVLSGLDSMLLGETEIVGQVKQAIMLATIANTLGKILTNLFQMGLTVEKIVRNSTKINQVAISIGNAVLRILNQSFSHKSISNKKFGADSQRERILFIGAGKMMTQIASHFGEIKFGQKTVINRSLVKAKLLANKIQADYYELTQLAEIIDNYTIVIACCYSDQYLLDLTTIKNNCKIVIDLSVPLVIKSDTPIKFFTIDDIAAIVDVGIEKRKIAATTASTIINDKVAEYAALVKKKEFNPLIKAMRAQAEDYRLELLSLSFKQLQNGESPTKVLDQFSIRLINKLLHNPTVRLNVAGENIKSELSQLTAHLYDLRI